MKKENGITMVVLVFTIVILFVIMGIVLFYSVGENGIISRTSKTAFEQDITQIKELVDEKETTYQLEGVTNLSILTENVKKTILEEYYDKLEIVATTDDGEISLDLYYKPEAFSAEEINWLKEMGIEEYKE